MRKIISAMLAIAIIFTLSACGKNNTSSDTDSSIPTQSEAFTAPENYASVLLITINPQFKLYLDENNNVLAVEPVNDDAKTFSDEIDFENKSLETVVETLVEKANEKGFVKENATVNFEITEQKTETVSKDDILQKAVAATEQKATELNITITAEAKETTDNTGSEADTSTSTSNTDKPSSSANKPTTSTTTPSSNKPSASTDNSATSTPNTNKPSSENASTEPDTSTWNHEQTDCREEYGCAYIPTEIHNDELNETLIKNNCNTKTFGEGHLVYCPFCKKIYGFEEHCYEDGRCIMCCYTNDEMKGVHFKYSELGYISIIAYPSGAESYAYYVDDKLIYSGAYASINYGSSLKGKKITVKALDSAGNIIATTTVTATK